MVFLRDEAAREAIEDACRAEGLEPLEWREVPGRRRTRSGERRGRACRGSSSSCSRRRARRGRGRAARLPRAGSGAERAAGAYIASLSFRTVTYKALCAADQLGALLPRPARPGARGAVRHLPPALLDEHGAVLGARPAVPPPLPQRRDQRDPGQRQLDARARGQLGSDDELLHPVVDESGSDSAMLDNALELLVRGGRDVRHALTMLVPEAWEGNASSTASVRDFYRYHSLLVEPWDGPAGARLHRRPRRRRGARPERAAAAALRGLRGGLVVCCSEAGAVDLSGRGPVRRGRLGPGEMIAVDPSAASRRTPRSSARLAARAPVRALARRRAATAARTATPVERAGGAT